MIAFDLNFMPHQPPMRLVDGLLESGEERAEAGDPLSGRPYGATVFQIRPGNLFLDGDGVFAREALVEIMAQAHMALCTHQRAQAGEKIPGGYLTGLRAIRFHGDARVHDTLVARTRTVDQIAQVALVLGQVFCGETLLAEGELRLYTLPSQDTA